MARRPLLLLGDKGLRAISQSLEFGEDPVAQYIEDLRDTLYHFQATHKIGRAIAGPQIGYLKRIIYMESTGTRIVMINPHVTWKSEETIEVWDSCFSADLAFFGKTIRHQAIGVDYFDEHQNLIRGEFRDDLAELFQHEIDHLDGILFTDRIEQNQIIMRSEWERLGKKEEVRT